MSIIHKIDQLSIALDQISSEVSLNGLSPELYWKNKIVIEENGRIYKIDRADKVAERFLIAEYCKKNNWDKILIPKIIKEYPFCIITEEEKVSSFQDINPPEKLQGLLGLVYLNHQNCGMTSEGVKIFDFAANVWCHFTGTHYELKDKTGEILLKGGFSNGKFVFIN